jgi:hypothetical protein
VATTNINRFCEELQRSSVALSHIVQSSQAVEGADTVDTFVHSILAHFEIVHSILAHFEITVVSVAEFEGTGYFKSKKI